MKLIGLLLNLILNFQFVFAHGGEDHGEKKKETSKAGVTYFTVNSVSDVFEMVLRYEPIEANQLTHMKLFVSEFTTNKAVDSAKIEITSPNNAELKFIVNQIDKGVYTIDGKFPENQSYNLVANISAGENADLMILDGIEVGKKLPVPLPIETDLKKSSSYLQTISAFLAGILITVLLLWLFLRRKKITINN